MSTRFSAEARLRYVLFTDAAVFVAGALLIVLISRVRSLVSPLAAWLLFAALATGFAVEIALWVLLGVRRVELEGDTLFITAGRRRLTHRVERQDLARIRITRHLARSTLLLKLRTGARLRIPEDAFPREAFARLLSALERWN
jgi:hypothetical protein